MTQEDKDKIVGQTRREYREAKQELAALQTKAHKLGELLAEIADVLVKRPSSLIFENQGHDGRFTMGTSEPLTDAAFADITAAKLRALGDSIRSQIIKTGDLRKRLTDLEGEDPEKAQSTGPHF